MPKKYRSTLPLTILVFVLLNACASADKSVFTQEALPTIKVAIQPTFTPEVIQVTDGLNRVVSVPLPAQRVVSLAPSSTEILFSIGAGAQVVGRDNYSDYPAEAAEVVDVGGGFGELNMEMILAQKPDLILSSDLTPPEQIAALENLGLTVVCLPDPKDFEGMYENVRLVARLTGHEEEAETVLDGLKKRVAAVEEKVGLVKECPLVFYELDGTDPSAPWTSGPGTFVDTLISMAGGVNLGSSLGSEWAQISIEELISRNPDLIILGSAHWGGVTPQEVKGRTGWGELEAVKNDRVFTFDDNLVSRPGPRLIDGLEAMAKLLHPEIFE